MASDTNHVGSLEEQALKRRERLKNLKRKTNDNAEENTGTEVVPLPKPKFRSYKPEDEVLKESLVSEAKPGDIDSEVKDQLNAANSKMIIEELDITNLAPRKSDWDLKRDVAKKLERLEKRTQKAIAELIRDRLKERQEDLAAIVNMAPMDDNVED